LNRAIELLQKAIRIEPASVLAHAYLASALTGKAHYTSDDATLSMAESEARRAVALAPNSADAHRALAGVLYVQGQFQQTLDELLSTAELHEIDDTLGSFIGMTLDSLGYPERALLWGNHARISTKRPGEVDIMIGDAWVKLGVDERALLAYQRAQELQPGTDRARLGLARLRMLQGDFDAARREIQKTRASGELDESAQMAAQIEFFARDFETAAKLYAPLSLAEPDGGGRFYGAVDFGGAFGKSLQELGRSEDARTTLTRCLQTDRAVVERQPNNPEGLYRLAAVESVLGLTDSSLQHLRSAAQQGWTDYRSLQLDPRFDSLRTDAQFDEIVSWLSTKVAEKRGRAETSSPPR
jgi:type IV pilus assembly protein PilF